jgi:hypothetical protein
LLIPTPFRELALLGWREVFRIEPGYDEGGLIRAA